MKAPVGILSGSTVCDSRWRGVAPTSARPVSYTHLDVYKRQTLRFVQESRSGNAAEKLLAMITTTCMVTRQEQEKVEIPMDDLVVGDICLLYTSRCV